MLVFIIEEEKCNGCGAPAPRSPAASQLFQWPVQIKLVPVKAPYLNGAKPLVADG